MIVLVSWCCNVSCHSVGRVPSSDPRSVRLPTAMLWFYPIPCLFVVSVCLGLFLFVSSLSCPFPLSAMSSPLMFLCVVCSLLRLPFAFVFMYCVNVFCIIFLLSFRFVLPTVSPFVYRCLGVSLSVRFVRVLLALCCLVFLLARFAVCHLIFPFCRLGRP